MHCRRNATLLGRVLGVAMLVCGMGQSAVAGALPDGEDSHSANLVATDTRQPAEVLLLGSFHFSNPQRDLVKTEQVDVMAEPEQAYLGALAARIAAWHPTAVLLEFDPQHTERINDEYTRYLADDFVLPVNEIYQLGFRVARLAGLRRVDSFDEQEVGWNAEPLFAAMKKNDPATQARFDALIERVSRDMARAHATLSLADLLRRANDPAEDRLNKSIYLLTNGVGAGAGFEGADAAASWWHRNFRMYARIQQHAAADARVLAIGGQGHVAILKDLAADDPDVRVVDAMAFF
ncbi:MAG: hypothetical protein KDJ14_08265 [Xanthomonadales bacterium]|nr:hypothetical protein [Xanthomonadales bacterium]